MNNAVTNNALCAAAERLVVPKTPKVSPKTADDVLGAINSALDDLRRHYDKICSERSFTNGALFLVDAINQIEGAAVDVETLFGYLNDLRGYAVFWSRLAQKLLRQYQPGRPVIYKPFDEV